MTKQSWRIDGQITPKTVLPYISLIVDNITTNIVEVAREWIQHDGAEVNSTNLEQDIIAIHNLMKIIKGDPYLKVILWHSDMWDAAVAGYQYFKNVQANASKLLARHQIWVPATGFLALGDHNIHARNDTPHPVLFMFVAAEMLDRGSSAPFNGFGLYNILFNQQTKRPIIRWNSIPYDTPLMYHVELKTWALVEFMNQEIITTPKAEIPSNYKKKKKSPKNNQLRQATVHTVQLRKVKHPSSVSYTAVVREWSCRWLVRPHWRNQWYPSSRMHKPKLIAAYVKGPDNKPFKTSKPIYEVVR